MIETNMRDIKTDKFKFKIQKNPASLIILDETNLGSKINSKRFYYFIA